MEEEKKEIKLGADGILYRFHCPRCNIDHTVTNYPTNIEKLRIPDMEGEYCFDCRERIKAEKAKNKPLDR